MFVSLSWVSRYFAYFDLLKVCYCSGSIHNLSLSIVDNLATLNPVALSNYFVALNSTVNTLLLILFDCLVLQRDFHFAVE